jgi:hypothetical protein
VTSALLPDLSDDLPVPLPRPPAWVVEASDIVLLRSPESAGPAPIVGPVDEAGVTAQVLDPDRCGHQTLLELEDLWRDWSCVRVVDEVPEDDKVRSNVPGGPELAELILRRSATDGPIQDLIALPVRGRV